MGPLSFHSTYETLFRSSLYRIGSAGSRRPRSRRSRRQRSRGGPLFRPFFSADDERNQLVLRPFRERGQSFVAARRHAGHALVCALGKRRTASLGRRQILHQSGDREEQVVGSCAEPSRSLLRSLGECSQSFFGPNRKSRKPQLRSRGDGKKPQFRESGEAKLAQFEEQLLREQCLMEN